MAIENSFSSEIQTEAIRLGFLDCGFATVRELTEHKQTYTQWIENQNQASMNYMERNIEKRFDPSLLVDGAKTVIVLLYNYFQPTQNTDNSLRIAKYAYGTDYHVVVKEKLYQLAEFIKTRFPDVSQRCFVDSAPVLERAWAHEAGLGWFGKNSCLINGKHGSFFFICEIITSIEIPFEQKRKSNDYCGNCKRCIEACPTNAINNNKTIDSNRCISYQTIENKTEIPENLKGKFEKYIFGCDICQDVCPWNKQSVITNETQFNWNKNLEIITSGNTENLTEITFRKMFKKSPIIRTKYFGIQRNIQFVKD